MAKYIKFMEIAQVSDEPVAAQKPRTAHLDLPRGAYSQLVYEALTQLGGTATLGQIVDHLRLNSRIPEAEHSYYSARSALNRHERIEKTEKGYRLRGLADLWLAELDDVIANQATEGS